MLCLPRMSEFIVDILEMLLVMRLPVKLKFKGRHEIFELPRVRSILLDFCLNFC
jgi:hypothetical protein